MASGRSPSSRRPPCRHPTSDSVSDHGAAGAQATPAGRTRRSPPGRPPATRPGCVTSRGRDRARRGSTPRRSAGSSALSKMSSQRAYGRPRRSASRAAAAASVMLSPDSEAQPCRQLGESRVDQVAAARRTPTRPRRSPPCSGARTPALTCGLADAAVGRRGPAAARPPCSLPGSWSRSCSSTSLRPVNSRVPRRHVPHRRDGPRVTRLARASAVSAGSASLGGEPSALSSSSVACAASRRVRSIMVAFRERLLVSGTSPTRTGISRRAVPAGSIAPIASATPRACGERR